MKNLINELYWKAEGSLSKMKKSEMKLSERIKYEKAMLQLNFMKKLIDCCTIEKT